jgi:CheY-like chemotaxis protein
MHFAPMNRNRQSNRGVVVNEGSTVKAALPNGRLPETRPNVVTDAAVLRARVQELETLCAEVYVAAVDLGLPQPLLNRLWTVGAQGSTPHTWAIDMPLRATPAVAKPGPLPIPDIKLTDRPAREGDTRLRPAGPELKPVAARRRVMVVDDDPMMMEVLVRILQRENFELITAFSGPEALQKANADSTPIDLLITDYAMPEMKGHELAERMRARYPEVRVLYQTGFSDMLFENKSELEDNAAFLEKPFTARGLREAARFILFGAINPA